MMMQAYVNGRVFSGKGIVTGKAVITEEGKIRELVPDTEIPKPATVIDLQGRWLVPAFIDLQIYGGNGMLFSQHTNTASLHATYAYCRAGGCSHFMITMATNSLEKFRLGMEAVRQYWQEGGRGLLGLHMEGPFINPARKGAHREDCIIRPTIGLVEEILDWSQGTLKMMTLAPEQCEPDIIGLLLRKGVLVSAGHSDANYDVASRAFDIGVRAATHLYNAMSPLQHRAPGMVGAIFNHSQVMSSLVCDGIHVDFAAVQIAKKIMGERLFYITDAVTEITEGEYQHVFHGDRYLLPNGVLSGSSLTMLQCVQNGVRHAGWSPEESFRMASLYPARLLGGDCGLGRIAPGFWAQMLVLDDDLNLVDFIDG